MNRLFPNDDCCYGTFIPNISRERTHVKHFIRGKDNWNPVEWPYTLPPSRGTTVVLQCDSQYQIWICATFFLKLYNCSDAAVITGLNHPARNYLGVVIRQQTGISRFSGFQALSCDKIFPDFSCSFMKPLIKSVTQQENLGMGFHEFVSFQQANQANGVSRPPPAYLA